jgi:hypothetical protein
VKLVRSIWFYYTEICYDARLHDARSHERKILVYQFNVIHVPVSKMSLQNLFQQIIHPGGHKLQKTQVQILENEEDIPREMFAIKL